jgi:hypothetical protein
MLCRVWFTLFFAICLMQSEAKDLPEVPFRVSDGLIWVDVTIPNHPETFHFLFDSGASVSVIDISVAQRLRTKLGDKVAVQGVQSEVTGYWRTRLNASTRGVALPKDYLALDLSALSGECKTHIDGLVGVDFFRGRVVEIDFEASVIRILNSAPKDLTNGIPLEQRSCGLRLPVTVNNRKDQWVRLDTGCASAFQWVAPEVKREACQGNKVAVGLSAITIPQITTRVAIGQFSFEQVPTGIHSNSIFAGEAGLLGNDLLTKFKKVTIDLKRNRLYLAPSMNGFEEKH